MMKSTNVSNARRSSWRVNAQSEVYVHSPALVAELIADQIFQSVFADEGITFEVQEDIACGRFREASQTEPHFDRQEFELARRQLHEPRPEAALAHGRGRRIGPIRALVSTPVAGVGLRGS